MLITGVLTACCPESIEEDRFFLSDEEMGFIPYAEAQIIPFEHSNGYNFELNIVSGIVEMRRTDVSHCGEKYYTYEAKEVMLESSIPEFYISLTITPYDFYPALTAVVNNTWFEFLIHEPADLDTMTINDFTFENVYISENFMADTAVIQPQKMFYNTTDGILQIQMTNDETYSLKK